jgi:hypothetical protein
MRARPDFITDEHIGFLDDLFQAHRVDLLTWQYLQETFKDLTPDQARQTMLYWTELREVQS